VTLPSARAGGKVNANGESDNVEVLGEFWVLDDKFQFDNVGFSNTVQEVIKYLSCADCDVGPLGIHYLNAQPERYLVATDRVRYKVLA